MRKKSRSLWRGVLMIVMMCIILGGCSKEQKDSENTTAMKQDEKSEKEDDSKEKSDEAENEETEKGVAHIEELKSSEAYNYVCAKDEWVAFYDQDGIQILKSGEKKQKYQSEFYTSVKIMVTESGFCYGRDDALCFFDFETEQEIPLVSDVEAPSPVLIYNGKLYFIVNWNNDPTRNILEEMDLKTKETRTFDVPSLAEPIVAGSDGLYYIAQRYETVAGSLYRLNVTDGTSEQVDTNVGMNLIARDGVLTYVRTVEGGAFLDVSAEDKDAEQILLDTNTGERKALFQDGDDYYYYWYNEEPVYLGEDYILYFSNDPEEDNDDSVRMQYLKGGGVDLIDDRNMQFWGVWDGYAYFTDRMIHYPEESYLDYFNVSRLNLETGELEDAMEEDGEFADDIFGFPLGVCPAGCYTERHDSGEITYSYEPIRFQNGK